MDCLSEAENRALDARCRLPASPASRSSVAKLRALSPACQALCIAGYAQCDLPHLVRCALDAGVSADVRWGESDTPVLCFAVQTGSERALKALLDGRANVALVDKKGWTAAHHAAYGGHAVCLHLLIDAGANLKGKAVGGATPLLFAAQDGQAECCSLLLAKGCDVNACDDYGQTPLIQAVSFKRTPCVRVLLPASDLSITTKQGYNAFHICIAYGNMECFEVLLPLISDVDVRTVGGVMLDGSPVLFFKETPLYLACSYGQHEMVKTLLLHGASRTARDSKQRMPLHAASRCGHLLCVTQLLGKQGRYKLTPDEVNAADVNGWTSLHSAAFNGHSEICGVLRAAGARLDALAQGITPLMIAQHTHPSKTVLIDLLAGRGPAHPPGLVCDNCGTPDAEVRLSTCTGCLVARYCGSACSAAAWPAHKAECRRVQAAREERCRRTTFTV